jgi:geranylgeranyl pyrophosphate synthase
MTTSAPTDRRPPSPAPAEQPWRPDLIEHDLERVEEALRARVASRESVVPVVCRHAVEAGGKRLRPSLVLLSARCIGAAPRHTIDLAVAAELVHLASMMHDDVIDQADLRRGRSSVNARWSNQISVLVGDHLIARLYLELAASGRYSALEEFTRAVVRMCEGELAHMELNGRLTDGEAAYMQIVADKTGSLMRACCRVGAHAAGASPDQTDALGEYGQALGVAFQIVDDLLDVVAEREQVGKPVRNDVEMSRPTLPVLHVLASGPAGPAAELAEALSKESPIDRERVARLAREGGGVAYAAQRARAYAQEACQALSRLRSCPATRALDDLSHRVAARASA